MLQTQIISVAPWLQTNLLNNVLRGKNKPRLIKCSWKGCDEGAFRPPKRRALRCGRPSRGFSISTESGAAERQVWGGHLAAAWRQKLVFWQSGSLTRSCNDFLSGQAWLDLRQWPRGKRPRRAGRSLGWPACLCLLLPVPCSGPSSPVFFASSWVGWPLA